MKDSEARTDDGEDAEPGEGDEIQRLGSQVVGLVKLAGETCMAWMSSEISVFGGTTMLVDEAESVPNSDKGIVVLGLRTSRGIRGTGP